MHVTWPDDPIAVHLTIHIFCEEYIFFSPLYIIFPILISHPPSYIQIFSLAPSTPEASVHFSLLVCHTK